VDERVKFEDLMYAIGMYRIQLTAEQRQELRRRTRAAGLAAATRDRLEMIRLSDAGWSPPRIARHLGLHEQTVRTWLKVFLAAGFDALANRPHARPQSALTPALLAATRAMIRASGRTWSSTQITTWLAAEHGVQLSAARVRFHLRQAGLSYQRTSRSLRHKQDPVRVAAHQAAADAAQKKPPPG
jgi:transposase